MKPASSKRLLACAALLPLLTPIGFVVLKRSSAPVVPSSVKSLSLSPSSSVSNATAAAAIHRLRQDASYDSLPAAYQAALRQPEPARNVPADVVNATHTMATPWRGLRTYFGPDAVQVRPSQKGDSAWTWDARLVSYGYGDAQQPMDRAEPVALKNGIEYRRGALTEWYLNDQRGLEQGFTLASRPESGADGSADTGPLTLTMAVETGLTPTLNAGADSVAFAGKPGEPVLHYAGLLAWDARGQRLAARIELRPQGALALLIDDRAASYPVTIDPILYVETQLTATDPQALDFFGNSIAMDGQTIVVGANFKSVGGVENVGAAYVFVRDGTTWVAQQKLIGSDAGAEDFFGQTVAISGDTIVVGASNFQFETGAAYVFVRTGTQWVETQKLMASSPQIQGFFGYAIGLQGDELIVGAPGTNTPAGFLAGTAYRFTRTGGLWSQQETLTTNDAAPGALFGISMAMTTDTLVIGATGAINFDSTGAAYVFFRSGSSWIEIDELQTGQSLGSDRFGTSVAVSGTTVLVGAPGADGSAGAVYAFAYNGFFYSTEKTITAPDSAPNALFGWSLGYANELAVIGSPGAIISGVRSGAAFLYSREGSAWPLQHTFTNTPPAADESFGVAVAMLGDSVGVTAPGATTSGGLNAGAAYIFENASVADLLVSQSADKTSVKQNDTLTYTLTVRNFGANRAANVIVNDTLPSGTVYKSAHANRGNFTAPPVNQTGVVTWYLGDIFDGKQESAQLVVTVTVKGKATLTNTATVQSDSFDPNLANNTSTLTTSVGSGSSGGGGGKK